MSAKDQAVSSVFWTAMQQFGSQGLTFIVSVILARLLEPEDFGIIALFGIITGIAVLLMSSGMTTSLLRSKEVSKEELSTVFWFNVVVAVLLYGIIFLIAPWVERFYEIDGLTSIIRVYSLIFVMQAFGAVQKVLITKALNFKKLFKIQLPSMIIGSISGILMAYLGFGVWALVYMGLIQYFLDVAQYWYTSNYKPSFVFRRDSFQKHFRFGVNMTITSIINVLFQNLYIVYIGKAFSAATLGFYNRAESLKNLPINNLMNILKRVLVPFFSTLQDDRQLKKFYKKIISSVLFLLSPVLVILIFQAEPIVRILLTDKWLQVVPYLQIICLSGFLFPLSEYNTNVLIVKGRSDLVLRLELYKKVITVLVFLVSLNWGIYGLLVGQVINSIIIYFVNSWYTARMIDYSSKEQMFDVLPYIVSSAVAGVATNLVIGPHVLNLTNSFSKLIGFTVLFVVLYGLIAKMFKLDALNDLLGIVRSKIFKKN